MDRTRSRERRRQQTASVARHYYHVAVAEEHAKIPERHNMCLLCKTCEHYGALHFVAEKGSLLHSCCHGGKALAPPLSVYPPRLRELLTGSNESQKLRNFRLHIRQYNNANAFANIDVKTVPFAPEDPYYFKITSEIHHLVTSSLVHDPDNIPI